MTLNPLFAIIRLFIYNNNIYNKYNDIINYGFLKENYKELYKIFKVIPIYKEHSLEGSIPKFSLFFFAQYPAMRKEDAELYISLFQKIEEVKANEDEVLVYLEAYKRKEVAHSIALKAIDVSEGNASFDDIQGLIETVVIAPKEEVSDYVSTSLEGLYERNFLENGIRWRLESLNKTLGSLRKGNFGFLAARPEVGKTSFLASEGTFMAGQLNSPLLWFNNEQAGEDVLTRCYQAALGLPSDQLFHSLELNSKKYEEITKNNIKIIDDANISKTKVEQLCKKYNPGLIFFDQLDKIKGFDTDQRHDLKLKDTYQWARELSKRYGPVIGVCQAGDSGDNKKWLQMGDIDSSKTAKQGEADWILGIGKLHDEAFEKVRYLHLIKNKLPGDKDTVKQLRHGKIDVIFKEDISRYEDRMKW